MRLRTSFSNSAFVIFISFALTAVTGTAGERSLSAAEANGTYRNGKSEIKILALGHGKLKVQLALVYKREFAPGSTANVGSASGEATIDNDVAVFLPEAPGEYDLVTGLPRRSQTEAGHSSLLFMWLWPQRSRRRNLSKGQQPQAEVRRCLMK